MCQSLQIPETVHSFNKDKLNIYYMNKRNIYPGCSGVIINSNSDMPNKFHRIEYLDPNYELQEGDVVLRDLIDGDYVGFNRQPSLLFGNISCHKVKVLPKGYTFRLNVSACVIYNADFDGDQMNVIVCQNIQSRVELAHLSSVGNWTISFQNHSPYFGCFQDSLVGSSEITRSDIFMDKYHAMSMFSNMTSPNEEQFNFSNNKYMGRELIKQFMPKINYPKKKAQIYKQQYAPFIKYDPDEIYVQIKRGDLVLGSLDKATVGQKVMGSIFHVINNEYGSKITLETIYNFHQLISRFFLWRGFTIGIKDINISEHAINQIKQSTQNILDSAAEITRKLNNRELIPPIGTTIAQFYEMEQTNALESGDEFVYPILSDINFRNNKLAQLVYTGSKGKETNVIAINSAIGKATINGRRPSRNFSWGRTSPYYTRYDTSPESCGFIATSFREGVKPEVFPFTAAEARHGSISNALSTSVSGAQNRLNIKNLESILTDNMRKCIKNENVIQPLYAESGIDIRKTEKVKFLTVMISDKEMEAKYHSNTKMFDKVYHNKTVESALDDEFKQLKVDRQTYRDIYFKIENNNPGQYLIDNQVQMPINPFRIIEDTLYNYSDVIDNLDKSQKSLDPISVINKTRELCTLIPYAYFNHIQEEMRSNIPEYIERAITLVKILIRTYLSTSNLHFKKINNFHLDIIIDKIRMTFKNSLVDYGSVVGIIAAQCLSEPLTQYVLDSKHRSSGGGGTSTNAIERIKEILGAKSSDKMKNTSMLIMVLPEYEKDKMKVQEIANYIEMMDFERFIATEHIFFEIYGNPIHERFKHEAKMIADFEKHNSGIKIPSKLSKWCIRYELNKEEMLINSMKLDTIIIQLRINFPEIYFVYTPENLDKIIIRCYLTHNAFKVPATGINEKGILDQVVKKINNTIIRGVNNIRYTEIVNIAKSEIQPDQSISTTKVYGIRTAGTNLEDVIDNPYVDKYRTQTDSIKEFEEMFGVEAARQKIINEIRRTLTTDDVIYEHCTLFSDEMCYSGNVTSIQKTGLQIREMANVCLRLSFQSPVQVIESAAINGMIDQINSISAPLICGQSPNIGSTFNNVGINESFVENYYQNLSKNIEEDL